MVGVKVDVVMNTTSQIVRSPYSGHLRHATSLLESDMHFAYMSILCKNENWEFED